VSSSPFINGLIRLGGRFIGTPAFRFEKPFSGTWDISRIFSYHKAGGFKRRISPLDPVKTDPVKTDPVKTDPVKAIDVGRLLRDKHANDP
jgi:hypothetical protein